MRTIQEHNRVSAIIPALDAGETLSAALSPLLASALVADIVVVDGGSGDDTVVRARAAGARVLTTPRGRGPQLAAGAAATCCEWLLFVHADCRLAPGWEEKVRAFVAAAGAGERAGYFDLVLDDTHAGARRLERLVAWRSRKLGLPYGDQGLLIARRLYDSIGGFAPLPLMEDVDLARRLGRRRLAPLGGFCIASARRYRRHGYWRRPLRNMLCLSLYFAGVPPRHIARFYR